MKKLNVDLNALEAIVISHDHGDHTGGISGEYKGNYMPEQALIVKTRKGISIITGCSHPDIVKMLKYIKELFPREKFYFAGGGFHLMDKSRKQIRNIIDQFKKIGVEKAH